MQFAHFLQKFPALQQAKLYQKLGNFIANPLLTDSFTLIGRI
jgi:hypothetical protein